MPDDWDNEEGYPRHRVRMAVTKAVALVLITGLLLAFPLGYLLDTELQNQHLEAGLVVIEVTIAIVLVVAVRGSRRRL